MPDYLRGKQRKYRRKARPKYLKKRLYNAKISSSSSAYHRPSALSRAFSEKERIF